MEEVAVFTRQILRRSNDHERAMQLVSVANIPSQMMAILRQELDSMVRVIYLLAQEPIRREELITASVNGELWRQPSGGGRVTDREMVVLAQQLKAWTQSVYKFGGAFIHLSNMHDYTDRDPMSLLSAEERGAILNHCRNYQGGPFGAEFSDLVPYLPSVLKKISGDLEFYLKKLTEGGTYDPAEV